MNAVESKKFEVLADEDLPKSLCNTEVTKCHFLACHFGETARVPGDRRVVRNVRLRDCKATNNSGIGPLILDSVEIENLATGGLFFARGAVYRHVKFSGRCGKFMLTGPASPSFQVANEEFYADVDWALDISEAEFQEIEIYGTPVRLAKRDPSTQVVVNRTTIEANLGRLEKLDMNGAPWLMVLETFLASDRSEQILIAPKRHKDFKTWKTGLDILCAEGLAER